ncbi:hypothetical protein ILYODFUR_021277 [Ilyodon furcidens]|uniref:Uncharacterized protein n=1 Tax=Ilyodon furcidens TaxID=33524 RepID=A0ABV0TZ98_9TELE
MENSQDSETSFQQLTFNQLSAELCALEKRYARTAKENEQLRETVYYLELQPEICKKQHQDEKHQLLQEIANLEQKVWTLRSLNNHLMNEEESKEAVVAETNNLKSKYCQEIQYLRSQLRYSEEVILHMEEVKAKQDAKITEKDGSIHMLHLLTESLRDSIGILKRQAEETEEEKVLLERGKQSIKDEFEVLGENINQWVTQNSADESQQQTETLMAHKTTQTETLSSESKQLKTSTEMSIQTESLTCESKRPKSYGEKSTQTDTLTLKYQRAPSAIAKPEWWWEVSVNGLFHIGKYTILGIGLAEMAIMANTMVNKYCFLQTEISF